MAGFNNLSHQPATCTGTYKQGSNRQVGLVLGGLWYTCGRCPPSLIHYISHYTPHANITLFHHHNISLPSMCSSYLQQTLNIDLNQDAGLIFHYVVPMKLLSMLSNLFTREVFKPISLITQNAPPRNSSRKSRIIKLVRVRERFNKAFVNFQHFTSTDNNIPKDDMTELLHNLLYTGCALLLAPN